MLQKMMAGMSSGMLYYKATVTFFSVFGFFFALMLCSESLQDGDTVK